MKILTFWLRKLYHDSLRNILTQQDVITYVKGINHKYWSRTIEFDNSVLGTSITRPNLKYDRYPVHLHQIVINTSHFMSKATIEELQRL